MKRFSWFVIPLVLIIPLIAFSGDFIFWGEPMATKTVYVDNTARKFQSLYERAGGTWATTDTAGMARIPIGVFLTCATTATHWGFGGTTPTTAVGHVFPADSSWHLMGEQYIATGMGLGAGANDNVTCQLTPER